MVGYCFDNEALADAFKNFNTCMFNLNDAYSKLVNIRENLMSYGWQGSSSQRFYNNLNMYIDNISSMRESVNNIIECLQNAATTKEVVTDASNQPIQ